MNRPMPRWLAWVDAVSALELAGMTAGIGGKFCTAVAIASFAFGACFLMIAIWYDAYLKMWPTNG